jgi:hypothetical protein
MKNLWDPIEANKYQSDLEQRVYSSRLLGRERLIRVRHHFLTARVDAELAPVKI